MGCLKELIISKEDGKFKTDIGYFKELDEAIMVACFVGRQPILKNVVEFGIKK